MSISKTTNTYNRQNWESSDFPILCQTCLGENPYVRMIKENNGKNCKICDRPFTVFRWCPGKNMRYKKTEVCQACSRLKNVCQTCILDLEYNLPTQVRDLVLQVNVHLPQSSINQEYFLQTVDQSMQGHLEFLSSPANKEAKNKNEILSRISRKVPFYKRNLPHICSFWIKGDCRRGELCPYRHEKPSNDDKLWAQNIKDRYFGINDPVAKQLIKYIEDTNKVTIHNNEITRKPKHINYFHYYYQQE